MAQDQHTNESNQRTVYVGDSRVKKSTKVYEPRDFSAYPGKTEAFVPNFLLKEWMVGAVVLVGFMVLVMTHPSPLGYPADPTNTLFIPMPDWYFLFMYQLLKYPYMSDHFVVLGTVGIPGLAFGALTLMPFLDTGKERRFYRRPIASALMFLSVAAVVYLTVVSWTHYQSELEAKNIIPEHIERAEALKSGKEPAGGSVASNKKAVVPIVAEDDAAYSIYQRATCVQCHGGDLKGVPQAGIPALRGIGDLHSEEELMDIIVNGYGTMGKQYDENLSLGLTEADLDALASWLAVQKKQE